MVCPCQHFDNLVNDALVVAVERRGLVLAVGVRGHRVKEMLMTIAAIAYGTIRPVCKYLLIPLSPNTYL
jgi:hypothetical protein